MPSVHLLPNWSPRFAISFAPKACSPTDLPVFQFGATIFTLLPIQFVTQGQPFRWQASRSGTEVRRSFPSTVYSRARQRSRHCSGTKTGVFEAASLLVGGERAPGQMRETQP